MYQFNDKVVLITGAGSGIGRAAALLFSECGAKVVVSNRNQVNGEETVREIRDSGGDAEYICADVSVHADVKNLINATVKHYGRLDYAFNNAGIDGKKALTTECEEDDWEVIIDTNLKGTFLLMKYQIQQMLNQGAGSIVNMSSVCGFVARPSRCAYNASRHGVIGLTKTAALEYSRQGIRVNAVAPASIKTDIYERSTQGDPEIQKMYADAHPIGRVGNPAEVAEAVLWLCSDKASFVTGHTLVLDGGFTIA